MQSGPTKAYIETYLSALDTVLGYSYFLDYKHMMVLKYDAFLYMKLPDSIYSSYYELNL